MLKRRLCEARLTWQLACEGPLLIADGRYEKKRPTDDRDSKKKPNKVFISRAVKAEVDRAVENARFAEQIRLPFFVPGTSLRGPVRAQAERILRTLVPGEPPVTACDPFQLEAGSTQSCSKRLDETRSAIPYAAACPACQLFGCTGTASRIQISDADITNARSVYRDMIGIDRFTGGVFQGKSDGQAGEERKGHGANMRFHVLEGARFSTTLAITNFELWQLGLLAFVLRDFEEGLVSIGFGKTKGFGQVTGTVQKIKLVYPLGRGSEEKIEHLGSLASQEEQKQYKLQAFQAPPAPLKRAEKSRLELFETFDVPSVKDFCEAVAPAFTQLVKARQPGEAA
jgi:CRISPR/Cas system CSM-associated protein Csm3 (group 7 of RAMP superfamily)